MMNIQTGPLLNDDTAPTLMVPGSGSGMSDVIGRRAVSDGTLDDHYEIVPTRPKTLNPNAPYWRVELAIDESKPPLMLVVIDSAVIGRSQSADINMDRYDNGEFGISRRHAMLRPSQRALFFFDLGSTNGTFHNGVAVGSGSAITLNKGDVIRLGRLTLMVRHIERMD